VGRAIRRSAVEPAPVEETEAGWTERLLARFGFSAEETGLVPTAVADSADNLPSLVSVISSSINIMQVRIARSRLAGEPADLLISPRVSQLGLMDYHRADEAIAEGVAAVARVRPLLRELLGTANE
jgi:NTE family protein